MSEGAPLTAATGSRVHVPGLDGLRGVAIVLVLLDHFRMFCGYLGMADVSLLDRALRVVFLGGWAGVDLFFTLSGFLITRILLATKGRERALYDFYGRRFLRIFPPYYLFLTIYLVLLPHLLPAALSPPELPHQGWYWSYLVNVRIALHGWGEPVLAHFWSLAVEEQFYVVWPFVVLACTSRTLTRVAAAMIAVALPLRALFWAMKMPEAAYVLTPCRMDSLAAGALIAVYAHEGTSRAVLLAWARRLGAAACVGVVAITAARGRFTYFEPVGCTLGISCLVAGSSSLVLAACFAEPGARLVRAMSAAWLRAVGRVSYAMYILHAPLLWLLLALKLDLRTWMPALSGTPALWLLLDTAVGSGVIYLLALTSWHVYEKRLLGLKRYFAG